MKMLKSLLMLATIGAATIFASCDPKGPQGGNEGGGDTSKVGIEITTGNITEGSLSFSVTTTNADKVLWWLHPTQDAITSGKLNMAEGTDIEAGADVEVKISDLKSATAYTFYVYAENGESTLYKTAYATTLRPGEGPAAPKVSVEGDKVTADSASFWIVCDKDCEGVWYLVVPEGESVTADKVKSEGTAITAEDIAYGEKLIEVTGLAAKTSYDVYAAAERSDVLGLSKVCKIRTQAANLFVYFNEVRSLSPESFGEDNRWLVAFTVVDADTGEAVNDDTISFHFVDTTENGYLGGTYNPISTDSITGEESSLMGFIPDGGYSNFIYKSVVYEFFMPEAGTESQYYVKISGGMVTGTDYNEVQIRLPYRDVDGNVYLLEDTYKGPLNYAGNSGAQTAERDNLYLLRNMTSEWDGNTVTLFASGVATGSITLVLNTPDGKIAPEGDMRFYEIGDNSLDAEKSNFTEYAMGLDTMDWVFKFTNGGLTFERLADSADGKERYQITLPKKGGGMIPDNPKILQGTMTEPKMLILTFVNNEVEQWIVTVTPKDEVQDETVN